jgi:HSP20 family protein
MLLTTFDALAEFDRIAQRAFGAGQTRPGTAAIRMDAVRRPHEIELRFDLPGIDTQSLDVTVDRGVLSVSAQRNAEFGADERPFIRQRVMGSFRHQVRLSDTVNPDGIEAAYEGGVLTVRVPLREAAQPRRVEVAGAAAAAVAPVETAPVEAVPSEFASSQVAPSEFASSEFAPVEAAPSEFASSEFAPVEAAQSEVAPVEAVQSEVAPTGTEQAGPEQAGTERAGEAGSTTEAA